MMTTARDSVDYYNDRYAQREDTISVTVNPATIHIDAMFGDVDINETLTIEQASKLFDQLAEALAKVGDKDSSR